VVKEGWMAKGRVAKEVSLCVLVLGDELLVKNVALLAAVLLSQNVGQMFEALSGDVLARRNEV